MRKLVMLLLGIIMLSGHLLAQTRTVTGKVTDAAGNPVPNASVVVKGTTIGTTTTEDGSFSFSIPDNARTLVISSIGMASQEVGIGNRTNFSITMGADDKDLQEVVVVGYGTVKKKEVTASISTVKGQAIANLPVQSFDNALGGRAAGVQITVPNGLVGNPPVFRVRGTNSLNLSSYPLIVIDGVPAFSGNVSQTFASSNVLSSINPNDIESIDILKDAAASAIYGSRAANGVVLITTKKGKSGTAKVTYDGWAGWTSPYGLWDLLDAEQYMQHKNMALANAGIPTTTTEFRPTLDANGDVINTNWYDHVYRTGFSNSHTVNVSGGNQTTNYYFSVGYTNQEGILVKNDFARKVARINVDHKPNKVVGIGGNFSYSQEINRAPNSGSLPGFLFSTAGLGRAPLITAPNVSPFKNDGTYNNGSNGLIGVMDNNAGQVGFYNPKAVADLNRAINEGNRVLGNIYLSIKPFNGLTLRTQYGIDYLNSDNELFYSPLHGDGFPRGLASSTLAKYRRWNWTNTAQYDRVIADDHSISVLVGSEQQYTNNQGFGLQMQDINDPFYTDIQGSYLTPTAAGRFRGENFLMSSFGRLNYDFAKKYYISLNGRQDEYSAFGNGNKKGQFWGISGAWDIAQEGFYSNSIGKIFSSMKIRASHGTVGNIGGIGDFIAYSFYGGGLYGPSGSLTLNSVGNPELQWETSKKTDIGLNFGILNDRITGEFGYYKNDIDGLIYNVPQAPSRGIPGNSLLENIGSMYNKGFEFTLNAGVVRSRDFTWNASFNFTTIKNEVTALAPGISEFTTASDLETVNITRVGEPLGALFVVRTAGVNPDNGNRIFINKAGQQVQYQHVVPTGTSRWKFMDGTTAPGIGSQDAVLYRPTQPKFYGGFDNNFRFKDFDFGFLLTFQGGNYVYNGTQAGLRDQRFWNNHTDVLRSWKKAGDETDIPLAIFGDNVSNGSAFPIDVNVEKGDFIKLRNMFIGYNIPKSILDRAKISNARFYVQGQNLAIFSKYSGPDPEVSSNGNGNTNPGVDRNSIANGRTLTVGLNIGF
ncbi:SusC/RagA family TonB-linked outer membrane protein [Flavihumibacter sp.]|uniref:SusC/RagA family TonB-linked outer membrane protein n=1 Tax=Flavihumibacter sp. TaxID=1913981 RepID=UPI002FC97799